MKTVIFVGTMVPNSRLETTLEYVSAYLDGEHEMIRAIEYDFGNFDPTLDSQPEEVKEIREKTHSADKIIIGTPMYNGSVSGTAKNMIDTLSSDMVRGKEVGFVIVSGGKFPRTASEHLSTMIRSLSGDVIYRDLLVPNVSDKVNSETGEVSKDVEENAEKFANILNG